MVSNTKNATFKIVEMLNGLMGKGAMMVIQSAEMVAQIVILIQAIHA